jgi:hypothetical protein
MNSIEQTQRVVNNFHSDLTALKAKKPKLVSIGGDTNDEKVKKLDTAIKDTKHIVKVSHGQLKRQIKWVVCLKVEKIWHLVMKTVTDKIKYCIIYCTCNHLTNRNWYLDK